MATDKAHDQVQAILAETARRKQVWAAMQRAAWEAVTAVTAEARKRGVRRQNWLGGDFDSDYTSVSFPTWYARFDEATEAKRPRRDRHTFLLYGSGTLERPNKGDTYEGYPNLDESDPGFFRQAAIEELMASLNSYLQRHGRGRGRPRR